MQPGGHTLRCKDGPNRQDRSATLSQLDEPRGVQTWLHSLPDILVLSALAVICGIDSFVAIARFGPGPRSLAAHLPDPGPDRVHADPRPGGTHRRQVRARIPRPPPRAGTAAPGSVPGRSPTAWCWPRRQWPTSPTGRSSTYCMLAAMPPRISPARRNGWCATQQGHSQTGKGAPRPAGNESWARMAV